MHSAVGHSLPHSPPTVVVAQQHIRLSERELFASWELPSDYGGQQQSIASDSIGHFASEGEENSSALDGDAREWGLAQSLAAWWHEAETDFERNKARDEQQPEPGEAPALALVESEPERDSARDKFPAFSAVTRWRARRTERRRRRTEAEGHRSPSFVSLSGAPRLVDVDFAGASRSPPTALAVHSAVDHCFGGRSQLSASERAALLRMSSEWRRRPADKPHATCICDRPDVRVWRWKGAAGPSGTPIDEYESEFELPIGVESFFAMQTEIQQRRKWDVSTKALEILQAGGSTELCALHGQSGDSQDLYWLVESPSWPLKHREYVMHRRLCRIADGQSGRTLYVRLEHGGDSPAFRRLRSQSAPQSVRCVDFFSTQVAWASVGERGQTCVRVRTRYREDPMTALPKWIVGLIIDKMLPRGLAALRKSALLREQRLASAAAESALRNGHKGNSADARWRTEAGR